MAPLLLLALAFSAAEGHKYPSARRQGAAPRAAAASEERPLLAEAGVGLLQSRRARSHTIAVDDSAEAGALQPSGADIDDLQMQELGPTPAQLQMQHVQLAAEQGLDNEPPEELEEYQDHGMYQPSRVSADEMESLASQITAESYGAMLHRCVDGRSTRYVSSAGNDKEQLDLVQMMQELNLTVTTEELAPTPDLMQFMRRLRPGTVGSVVGSIRGSHPVLRKETIVLGAHFDSVNWVEPGGAAPGVDDNGSGIALVLLAAKLLAQRPALLDRSVLFVLFNAEEEGTIGSAEFVPVAKSGKYGDVKAALIADEVAFPGSGQDRDKAIFETHWKVGAGSQWLVDTLARSAKPGDGVDGFAVNYNGFGSDHMSFLDAGIPSILLIERDNMQHADKWGHSAMDTWEHVDVAYGAAMARLMVRALVTLASPQQA